MKLLTIAALLSTLLVLLLTAQLTIGKPANKKASRGKLEVQHEEARRRWSGAKRLYRRHVQKPRRYSRKVEGPVYNALSESTAPIADVEHSLPGNLSGSGSKYIFDLYNNLSKGPDSSTRQHMMHANTVRSLEATSFGEQSLCVVNSLLPTASVIL